MARALLPVRETFETGNGHHPEPESQAPFLRRHVLDLDDFSRQEICRVLDTAVLMREALERPARKLSVLRDRTVVNLFYEASTRTRVSFELAAKHLGANAVNMASSGSSVEKGESLADTLHTLEALGADAIVMRHPQAGAPYLAAEHFRGSVINAGDGWHAHPTQGLLDAFTIRDRLGSVAGRKVVIVGDILHSRVARSNVWALTTLGAEVVLCGPPTLIPSWFVRAAEGRGKVMPGVQVSFDLDSSLRDADVIMALRLQQERQQAGLLPSLREYVRLYQITPERVARAKPDALVMHPGPMNEGVEIAPEAAHGLQSVILEQVANGVAVRMALLYLLLGSNSHLAAEVTRR